MLKFAVDAGHGLYTAGKRCPDDSMREFHFNSVVARYVAEGLSEYVDVETFFVHDPTGAADIPLAGRVSAANQAKAAAYISIHANAAGTGWNDAGGIETFVAVNASVKSVELAKSVQQRLVAATKLRDRCGMVGVKRSDFYVVKHTAMPAILVECGFMTNKAEAALLKSDSYRKACAEAVVAGIAEVYGLKRRERKESKTTEATVIVNGRTLAERGYVDDGVTYVPVRAVAEALGATVGWDGANKTVTISI